LTGSELYKKFSQRSTLRQKSFDPLNVTVLTPEMCGYGLRHFRLSKNLQKVEIKQAFKPGVETVFGVDQMIGPVIPQLTMTILKVQKRYNKPGQTCRDFLDGEITVEEDEKLYQDMRDRGILSENSEIFQKRCRDCTTYPFSISMANGGRIELLARNYLTFKLWVNGLNTIVKHKRHIPRLAYKVEPS
jgi:hypothetical protein